MKKLLGSLVALTLGTLAVLALAGFLSRSVQETYVAHTPVALVAAAPGDDFDLVDCATTGGNAVIVGNVVVSCTCPANASSCEAPGVNNGDLEPTVNGVVLVDGSDTGG